MGSSGTDEFNDAARRRLELLRAQLQRDAPPPNDPVPAPVLPAAGRHVRRTVGLPGRLSASLSERVPATMRGRVRLGGRQLAVLSLVLGLALAIAGCVAIRSGSGQAGEPVPAAAPLASTTPGDGAPSALVTPGGGRASPTAEVVVDVSGKVRRPGVFTLPAGSRVIDALERAGGARSKVDLSGINLARLLTDGEQVLVGQAPAPGAAADAAATGGGSPTGGLLSLNQATLEQLDGLPGVGPVTAQKILTWRETHGSFSSVDELLEIDGIGDKTLAELAPMLTL